jgi:hypothetical protein
MEESSSKGIKSIMAFRGALPPADIPHATSCIIHNIKVPVHMLQWHLVFFYQKAVYILGIY